jgi:predicted RNase H-related nuclease YkuK (DUF458 family)
MVDNKLTGIKDVSEELLNSLTHGEIRIIDSIKLIKDFLEEKPDEEYSLVIGTDSHEKENNGDSKTINLVTAVLVHRRGFGGKYFWRRKNVSHIHSLREKIYAETLESLNFALSFVPLLRKTINGDSPSYNLEIHIDVGEHGDTRDMIKEVVGMVTGSGFVARTKPHAYGASYVADKHT